MSLAHCDNCGCWGHRAGSCPLKRIDANKIGYKPEAKTKREQESYVNLQSNPSR